MTTTTVPASRAQKGWSHTVKNYWLDIVLFFAFIIDMNFRFTGIAIHEWLGIGFGLALIYHLLLHWDWIISVSKRLFRRLPGGQRVRYLVDLLLFLDMVILSMTGIWISEVAMQQLGISVTSNFFWRRMHTLTADFAIWLVALHLALSWKWIVSSSKRYLLRPLTQKRQRII